MKNAEFQPEEHCVTSAFFGYGESKFIKSVWNQKMSNLFNKVLNVLKNAADKKAVIDKIIQFKPEYNDKRKKLESLPLANLEQMLEEIEKQLRKKTAGQAAIKPQVKRPASGNRKS